MLAYLRKNANSFISWLIIGAIAVVFIFFGLTGQGGPAGGVVTVNGEEANPYEYEEMVQSLTSQMNAGAGEMTPEIERDIRLRALSEQVNRILIRQFGEKLGLRPGPGAVREAVAAMEAFQEDGRFSLERYRAALAARRQEPGMFENEVRAGLASERAAALVAGLARAYGPELAELFHFQEDRLRFDFLFLAEEDGRWDPRPKPEDLTAFYAGRQEQWRRPAEMTLEYVEINPADFLGQVEVSETELAERYAEDQGRLQKPEAEARAELTEELKAVKARALAVSRLEELLDSAELNPDLAGAAQALGLRAARSRAFTPDAPPGFFENNAEAVRLAFAAPLNQLAPPFEGDRSLVLYIPRSRLESRIPPLDEVREEVDRAWRAAERDRLTAGLLESYLPQINEQGWEAYAAGLPQGGPLKSGSADPAGRFSLAAAPPFSQSEPRALAAAVHSVGGPGQIVPFSLAGQWENRPGRFLLRLAEIQPADESRLEGPEGLTYQSILSMGKGSLMYQVWRSGLYEASKDAIVVPQSYLPQP